MGTSFRLFKLGFLVLAGSVLIFILPDVNTTQAEGEKPVVISTNPSNGESGVSQYTDWVSVTFSETMNGWSSVSSCSDWNLSGAQIDWSNDQKIFYFSRADAGQPLAAGKIISFTLNPIGSPMFQDTEGNYLDTYYFSFTIETPNDVKAMPWIPLLLMDD